MATGNRVLPGAPAMTAHMEPAGQAVIAGQAIRGGHVATAGQPMTSRVTNPGSAVPDGQAATSSQSLPRLRRGAGGRWLLWVMRALVWAILLLIGYRGVAAIVAGSLAPSGTRTAPRAVVRPDHDVPVTGFPVTLAQAYALEFGQVYLSSGPGSAAQRASSLAAFLPPGAGPQLGGTGAGSQVLQAEQVAGVRVVTAHRAVVTLLAQVSGHLIELAVPIYATRDGIVVSGQPAVLPAPAQVTPPASAMFATDPAIARTLTRMLPPFFRAFASGGTSLREFTADGTQLSGLGGAVTFDAIRQLAVSAAGGATRQVLVTVSWRVVSPATAVAGRRSRAKGTHVKAVPAPTARIVTTYAMTVVRSGGAWRVRSIGAAAAQPWPPS